MLARVVLLNVIVLASFAPSGRSDEVPPTPGPQDIPTSQTGEIALAGAEYPDITRFLNVRSAVGASVSPDGSLIAFTTAITGVNQLWTVPANGGWPKQLTFGEDGISFLGFSGDAPKFSEFSPTGEWLLYGADRGGNERTAFYLITPDGMKERELLPPSMAFRVFGGFSPDGSSVAYATTSEEGDTFDIHVIDIFIGTDRLVYQGRMGLYVASWRPDGKALLLTEARGETANDVFLLDLQTKELTTLFQPENEASYRGFSWLQDSSGFYVVTDQDREFAALAFYSLASGRLSFTDQPDFDVQGAVISGDGRYLAWTTNENGWGGLYVRDLTSGEMVDLPDLPRGVLSINFAKDSPTAAITVRGPQVPGDIWNWNIGDPTATRVTKSSLAGLDASDFVIPEHIEFSARDDVTLRGLLYLPKKLKNGRKPAVVIDVHGGPSAQARPLFDPTKQYLVSRGIAVFDFNYRGSTGYGKTFARLDNQRRRLDGVYDLGDALDFLNADGRVDASRAAVMGGSYGGFLAFAAVTFLPDRFDAAASFVGVSDWVSALEGASPQLKASDRIEYGDIDDPDDREFFRQISPITHIDNVKTPLFVVHGANDPRCPVSESDKFVRAIRERDGEATYLRFPDEGHGIRKLKNRGIMGRQLADFLEQELQMEKQR